MQRSIRSRLIQERLASIRDRITAISPERQVRLVAVSKKMPVEDIQSAYDYGHRDFGENYVNELTEKSSKLPSDIQWRFIGHLQSNKVQNVLSVKNLRAIETLDSPKLARLLNKHWDNRDVSYLHNIGDFRETKTL